MSDSATPYPELLSLFIALSDESISDADFARLDAMLADDPQARAFYLEFMRTSAMLEQRAESQAQADAHEVDDHEDDLSFLGLEETQPIAPGLTFKDAEQLLAPPAPPAGDAPLVDLTEELKSCRLKKPHAEQAKDRPARSDDDETRHPFVISKAAALLVIAAMLGLVAWLGWPDTEPTDSADPTAQQADASRSSADATNVAMIRSSYDARWAGLSRDHRHHLRGDKTVTLRAGLAEIVFDDGASVIIQGPATFEPIGPNAMRLDAGRIVATIPDSAHGFTVATANGLITDYGTEFGVNVEPGGQAKVQTFSGRIGVVSNVGTEVELTAGDAVSVDTQGQVETIEAQPLDLVQAVEYEAILNPDNSPRNRWVATRYWMLRNPHVVAFIPFVDSDSDWPAGIGYKQLRRSREPEATEHVQVTPGNFAPGVDYGDDAGFGKSLVTDGARGVYIDLDTSPGGAFDTAGLLDENGLIGKAGTTLYLQWRMQGDLAESVAPLGAYAGVCFLSGDRFIDDEPLFLGRPSYATYLGAHPRQSDRPINFPSDIRSLMSPDGLSIPADNQAHLWLVRIDFAEGVDHVSIYLDPDMSAGVLPHPHRVLDYYEIAFDRLALVDRDGASGCRLDDILISTAPIFDDSGMLPED